MMTMTGVGVLRAGKENARLRHCGIGRSMVVMLPRAQRATAAYFCAGLLLRSIDFSAGCCGASFGAGTTLP